eukprot:gene49150-66742_t
MTLFVGSDSPAIPIARHIQLIASWTFVMFGATMVLFSTVRANGSTLAPLIILIVSLYPVRIGIAMAGQPVIGADALWWAFPIGSADIKALYSTAFEVEPQWLVEAASRRQKWIDQAQSLNIYMAGASGKKLDDTYKLAWLRGLKTTYYLRTMAATH